MREEAKQSSDLLGLAPYGRAVEKTVEKVFEGSGAFLGRICLPAAEEVGLLLREKVGEWRRRNADRVARKAEELVGDADLQAPPRLVIRAIELGSWTDDEHLQQMWAGLLASSCSVDGVDDGNLIFINLLESLTGSEVRILGHLCRRSKKGRTDVHGVIMGGPVHLGVEELGRVSGILDVHRLDSEIDHLRSLELLEGGIHPWQEVITLTPTSLALNLYARSHGWRGPATEFFDLHSS